jgi:DNA-binding SARP family transcriptional activator/class 3 adenylate cyclase/tetratricopeptide (TPR) repeat protein
MEFLILGPLEARVDGRALALGGAKQRSLLALLLLHRNEVVSTDRLVDGLWGEAPPATAVKVVQVYVSRLRRLLWPSGEGRGRLLTRPPGYLLELGADELDLDRFEGLVERAGRAMAGGDPAAASAALGRGLAMWRGPPLADLAFEPFARAAGARLEEQRLAALESRVAADLALGRAPELIGELGALVGEHPLRERLRGSLVLALYRAGRQAEALEAYRDARRALVDDLGIEPSPELAELERAILRHDPALALPPAAAPPASAAPAAVAPEPPVAPGPPPRPAQEGERKRVTVLVCDIVGSTALMELLGAEAMHELLGRFHDLARDEVSRYGGWVSSVHGDGFVALMGAPAAHEDHALRAVLAALGLRRRLAEGALAAGDSDVPIRVRMGLDSGLVVLGSMGSDPGGPPAAIGETVVVAGRLQRLAEPGTILAGEATARMVAGAVRLEPLGPVRVEGKGDPVSAHRVVGVGPQRSPQAGLDARPLGRFVGRERLLAALAEAMALAREGHGQVVGIVGEPGMGKSRLVIELRRSLSGQRITLTEGRCLSYGSSTPYLPVRDHIRATCGITEADVAATVSEKLRFALEEIGLEPDEREPFLLHLLGAEEQADALAGLTPEAVKARTLETLVQMALSGSRRRPLVLVYEDLHWVDTLTEEVLAGIAHSIQGAAILLLCTYRPGYQAAWLGLSYARQLSLQPLTPSESADVIGAVPGGDELPGRFVEAVIEKAEGNPFFAEELTRAARDGHDEGAAIAVPGTVRDVLAARIDLLPDAPRRLLRTASVIGREFSPLLLEPLWDEGSSLEPELAQLKRLEFVYERISPDGSRYVFAHALTHEVAYDGLLVSTRSALHETVGQMLERQYADRLDEVVDLLARHYSRTQRTDKAVEYLSRSAEKAVQGYAHAEAARALEEALPHAERLPAEGRERRVLALVIRLVTSMYFIGRFEEGRDLLLSHQPRVDALGDPLIAGEYYFFLGHFYAHVGGPTGSERFATHALEEAERAGDGATIGKARIVLAWEAFFTGRYEEGAEHARTAVVALEPTEEWWWLGYALGWEAVNDMSLGEFDAALRVIERARAVGRERQDPRLHSYSAWMRGRIRAMRGDWEAAIADLNESIESSPDPLNNAYAMGWLGFSHREKGDHAQAITLLEQSVASMTEFRFRRLVCVFGGFLAGAYRSAGRLDEAREAAEGALSLSEELRYPWSITLARRELGRIDLAVGDLARAERALGEALDAFTAMAAAFEAAVTRLDLAELALLRGQPEAAAQHLETCRQSFADLGAPAYLARAEALARCLNGSAG